MHHYREGENLEESSGNEPRKNKRIGNINYTRGNENEEYTVGESHYRRKSDPVTNDQV